LQRRRRSRAGTRRARGDADRGRDRRAEFGPECRPEPRWDADSDSRSDRKPNAVAASHDARADRDADGNPNGIAVLHGNRLDPRPLI